MHTHMFAIALATAFGCFALWRTVAFGMSAWKRKSVPTFEEWERHSKIMRGYVEGLVSLIGIYCLLVSAVWLGRHWNSVLQWVTKKLGSGMVDYFVLLSVLVIGMLAHY